MQESKIRVLLVEDNPGDLRLIQHYLRKSPLTFEISHADRVQAGIRQLRESGFDVILLDMNLPDSDPPDTFNRVYSEAGRVPIIVLTGISDEETALKAVREGAQDYLVKRTVDSDRLTRAIRYSIERKHSAEKLRESQERYALAVRGANDGIWDWNLKTNRAYFSPRWLAMLGLTESDGEEAAETWFSRVHPHDLDSVQQKLTEHINSLTPLFQSEHRVRCKNGRYLWVLARAIAVRDKDGRAYRVAGSLTDISDRKEAEEQLLHDAFHDALTGLPNRALFMDRLGVSIAHSARRERYLFAVLFLDLDRFKNINDSLGHLNGDLLLKTLASRLTGLLRMGDTVARLGGDEFAILLDDIEDPSHADQVATRVLFEITRPVELDGHEVFTTASIGIALNTSSYERAEDVLRDADIAMYQAKSEGKNKSALFDHEMRARAVEQLTLESDLRRAVDNDELFVKYQPIVSLETGAIASFEALIRWRHPERGVVSPVDFIPAAEETGIIVEIGHYVLAEACRQMSEWHEEFPEMRDLSVSVNLSAKEFLQPDLLEVVQHALIEARLQPRHLRLEITESIIMDHNDPIADKLRRLRDLGIELHIDDFGTGYSSLSYLHKLPASTLKIDRSFVRQVENGDGRSEIVGAIVSLARNLGMHVSAEGLENAEQLECLRDLKCEFGQGFFFSKPLSGPEAESLLSSSPWWLNNFQHQTV